MPRARPNGQQVHRGRAPRPRRAAGAAGRASAARTALPPLAELRARSTEEVDRRRCAASGMIIDGWIVPEDLSITFANGKQNAVDVIAGFNKDEHTAWAATWRSATRWRGTMRLFAERQTALGKRALLVHLHARAADRAGRARPEGDARRRDRLRLQQPLGAARDPRSQLAEAGDGVGEGPGDGRSDVVVLGELRADRRPERQGSAGVGALQGSQRAAAHPWHDSGTSERGGAERVRPSTPRC